MPLIGVLTPFVVHVAAQSVCCLYNEGLDVHVVLLLFSATHLVTAWASVVVMAHSIAPVSKNCFEIFITLFPPYVHIDSCFGGQSPQNPKGRLDPAFF